MELDLTRFLELPDDNDRDNLIRDIQNSINMSRYKNKTIRVNVEQYPPDVVSQVFDELSEKGFQCEIKEYDSGFKHLRFHLK